ncbi:hypothetical protein RVR_4427 [Actinacidiphila reveromycinica]|uniref:Uncharacterized protein n=1 Tax=Actinacidiphila reveromycinica TaxID=659352 RepID=A0A7U3UT67_9ACTN|nr:hypothetical protein [Streptomyces sp. SN-593]BBA98294.1 hypothetical protein RVR_4427 [Streptomyces sp. SN-593]
MTLNTTVEALPRPPIAAGQAPAEEVRSMLPYVLVVCDQDRGESPFGWSDLESKETEPRG